MEGKEDVKRSIFVPSYPCKLGIDNLIEARTTIITVGRDI